MARCNLSQLVLLLGAAFAFGSAAALDPLFYMKQMCNNSASNAVGATGLSIADCETCMDGAAATSAPNMPKVYACSAYCQLPPYFPPNATWNDTNTWHATFATPDPAKDCSDCITSATVVNPWACQNCMQRNPLNVYARKTCFECVENDPWAGQNNSYFYACAECATITDPEAYKNCSACVASQEYDYGKCVYLANQIQALNNGSFSVLDGMAAQCVAAANATSQQVTYFNVSQCITCMNSTISSNTAFGCAQYCMDPTIIQSEEEGIACSACVTSSYQDPWGCYNCLSMPELTSPSMKQDCINYIIDDPYKGNVSNYNWAVGQCASIANADIRNACYMCIQNQNATAEDVGANICSCVDLTKNQGRTETEGCPNCDAMESQCFSNWTILNVSYDLSFDNRTVNGEKCLQCMNSTGANAKQYACNQYCMDPFFINSADDLDECIACVTDASLASPHGCQACISATNDTAARSDCYSCVRAPSGFAVPPFPEVSRDWACGQCASMADPNTVAQCYECVAHEVIDPCQCVDGANTGALSFVAFDKGTTNCLNFNSTFLNLDGLLTNSDVPMSVESCAITAHSNNAQIFGVTYGSVCVYITDDTITVDNLLSYTLPTTGSCDVPCSATVGNSNTYPYTCGNFDPVLFSMYYFV